MKIVHLVTDDIGGAGRAARRISDALNAVGQESKVIVLEKYDMGGNTIRAFNSKIRKTVFKCIRKATYFSTTRYADRKSFSDSFFGADILSLPEIVEADIVNLHWVNYGYLSYKGIRKLALNKKIVWTLHDMWPFTAGCYYNRECNQYHQQCRNCDYVRAKYSASRTKRIYEEKEKMYQVPVNINFVGCSKWITQCASQSALTRRFHCDTIHNPIDIETFVPRKLSHIRKKLGISDDTNIILFGAMTSDSDPRKGYQYLKEALQLIDIDCETENVLAVVFGNQNEIDDELSMSVKGLGMISDDIVLSEIYSMADVFVAPSVQENLSNAVMESLSCGTPVVAFDVGGMKDMIVNEVNGYLVTPFDVNDLAKGINFCIKNNLSKGCREYVEEHFTYERIGRRYEELYMSILKE